MKTICFFDDWMLDARQDIVREFGTPLPDDRDIVFDDGQTPPCSRAAGASPTFWFKRCGPMTTLFRPRS